MNLIRAKITDKDDSSGRWLYEWEEQAADQDDGADLAPDSARSGTFDVNPATEINDSQIDIDTVVWLRERGYVGGSMWYEFASPGVAVTAENRVTDTAITADNPTYYTVATITLPSAGVWFVFYTISALGQISGGTSGRLYSYVYSGGCSGDGLNLGQYCLQILTAGVGVYGQAADSFPVVAAAANAVVELRVSREGSATWTACSVLGYPAGNQGRLWAVKIGTSAYAVHPTDGIAGGTY